MSSSNLIRWSGLAALVGAVLLAILEVIEFATFGSQSDSAAAATSAFLYVNALYIVAILLIFLGLVGLYARQAEQAGTLGVIAFVVAFIGMVMMAGLQWSTLAFGPWLAEAAPELMDSEPTGVPAALFMLTLVFFAIGWLLFGFASLQARVLQRGASILLIIGSLLFLVGFLIEIPVGATIIFGAAVIWLGYSLWSNPRAPASIAEQAA
jgi:hypothetical protein